MKKQQKLTNKFLTTLEMTQSLLSVSQQVFFLNFPFQNWDQQGTCFLISFFRLTYGSFFSYVIQVLMWVTKLFILAPFATVSQDGLGNFILPTNVRSDAKYSFSSCHVWCTFQESRAVGNSSLRYLFCVLSQGRRKWAIYSVASFRT